MQMKLFPFTKPAPRIAPMPEGSGTQSLGFILYKIKFFRGLDSRGCYIVVTICQRFHGCANLHKRGELLKFPIDLA